MARSGSDGDAQLLEECAPFLMEWPKFFIDADHAVACADPISPHTMLARRNIAMLRRGGSIILGYVCDRKVIEGCGCTTSIARERRGESETYQNASLTPCGACQTSRPGSPPEEALPGPGNAQHARWDWLVATCAVRARPPLRATRHTSFR